MTERSRAAIVTGASRGIGRAIALKLAKEGCSIIVTARNHDDLDRVAAEAEETGAAGSLAIAADLSQPGEPERVVAAAIDRFGGLEILVNNAGATKRGDFLSLTDDDHLDGFALKYHATVRFCRAAWPHLVAARGAVVNITGIGAHTPDAEFTIGGPVNSALTNFTKALANRALDEGVRVNTLSPGHIVTDRLHARIEKHAKLKSMTIADAREDLRLHYGIHRFGETADIANMVAFLCSKQASYVHGTTVIVDGGATPGI
ncbi:SDR family oxidoreductase [uncultured Nisaea sp.]|uniref:SDR family oxidoreductase n=1 Tax=uncultured Nisaea sp. TaxID=538215 RepID=UPI0030EE0B6D|tara:strand:+ start:9174 stop:9953 length:780 start_codon:yes stop_codon:yes gene_type:complete